MTGGVGVDSADIIRETAPILRRFIGQPISHLLAWQAWTFVRLEDL